jgi:Tol biopolymer transport system component
MDGGDTTSLVAQPMSNGAPSGPALTVRRGVTGWASGMTASGGLLLTVNEIPTSIYGATLDVRTGALTGRPSRLVVGETNRQPRYSTDGARLAFLSGPGPGVLSIQRLDTGQRAILPLPLRNIGTYDWSPDGRLFLAGAADLQGRQGIFQIDAATGNVTPLLLNSDAERHFTPHWAADGRHFYVTKGLPAENRDRLIERDLQTGTERVLLDWSQVRRADGSPLPPLRGYKVSPDGRHVVALTRAPQASTGAAIWIASLTDRSARQLLAVPARQFGLPILGMLVWTPDSQAVLINRAGDKPGDNRALWIVPVDGSSPRQLAIDLPLPLDMFAMNEAAAMHPDGKRIAFVTGTPRSREIRLLEDFLPAPPGRR